MIKQLTLAVLFVLAISSSQAAPVQKTPPPTGGLPNAGPQFEELVHQALETKTSDAFLPILHEILETAPGVQAQPNNVAECIAWCTAKGNTSCMAALGIPFVGAKVYAACMAAVITTCSIECA